MSWTSKFLTVITVVIVLIGSWHLSVTNEKYLVQEFLTGHEDKLDLESDKIIKIFDNIYTNMRAMAFTKEVKGLSINNRMTPKEKSQLQNFFEAIAEDISLSEIYLVPVDTKLSNFDSPHDLPESILALVPKEKMALKEEEKGVETYELKEIATQMSYLLQVAPTLDSFEGVKVPATTGKEVIICDNREQESSDSYNTGFIYSIPYYNFDGKFAGVLSAVIKKEVITRLFDDPYYQLKREIDPTSGAPQGILALPKGDAPLILSRTLPIIDRYPWTLEMKVPANIYQSNPAIQKIKLQKLVLQGLGVSTAILILILVFLSSNNLLIKRLNSDLRQEIKMRERTEEHLSQFTSDAGHELRSPLAIMKGEVEVSMLKDRSTAEYKEVLGHVYDSINRLQQLVIDLLTISRMEQGMEELKFSPTLLADLIDEEFRIALERKGDRDSVKLDNHIDQRLMLTMDEAKMRIALSNILSNALKYAPANTKVEARCLTDDTIITLLISDQGIGVDENDFSKMFDRFYRTERARTIGLGGLGLGLSIVKKIIELHGGSVRAYNGALGGLTVEIKLPV